MNENKVKFADPEAHFENKIGLVQIGV